VSLSVLLCLVVAISDGDTLTARCGTPGAYRPVKVRIAAIDAPESKQAFGLKSKQHLAKLCFKQQARLQLLTKDDYGRTVANVQCAGKDAAARQVAAGMAWVYTPYAQNHLQLLPLQQRARSQRTGLWSQKRPQAPWMYRSRQRG
jgi:endonuclease YncB( thermonuclease family)